MRHLALILLLGSFCHFADLCAQNASSVRHLGKENGLSFRNVRAIGQDSAGFIWLATTFGIDRYDGKRILSLADLRDGAAPLPCAAVNDFLVVGNTAWVLCEGDLLAVSLVDYSVGWRFADDFPLPGGEVLAFDHAGAQGLVVVVHSAAKLLLGTLSAEGGWRELDQSPAAEGTVATHLQYSPSGLIWSTPREGVIAFDAAWQRQNAAVHDSSFLNRQVVYYSKQFADSRARTWKFPSPYEYKEPRRRVLSVCAGDRCREVVSFFSNFSLNSAFAEDADGEVWIGLNQSLYRVAIDGGLESLTTKLNAVSDFTTVNDLFQDRSGNVWVATNNGAFIVPRRRGRFSTVLSDPLKNWGKRMRRLTRDRHGILYALSEGEGLYRYAAGDSVQLMESSDPSTGEVVSLRRARELLYDSLRHEIWSNTDKGIIRLELERRVATTFPYYGLQINPLAFVPTSRINHRRFYVGNRTPYLYAINVDTYAIDSVHIRGVPGDQQINYIFEDAVGTVWLGTRQRGVYRIGRDGDLLEHYGPASAPQLTGSNVQVIEQSPDGSIWIGTLDGGAWQLDPVSGSVLNALGAREGLPNERVVGFAFDGPDSVWMSTYEGLCLWRSRDGVLESFYESDGLSNNEFNYLSFLDHEEAAYFGGMNGITRVKKGDEEPSPYQPSILLTEVSLFSTRTNTVEKKRSNLAALKHLRVAPSIKYVQLDFALTNFVTPGKNQYAVWLEGFEPDFTDLGNATSVRYNNLPGGHYRLHIRGHDGRPVTEARLAPIDIEVVEVFYTRPWFIAIIILLFALAVASLMEYRYRTGLRFARLREDISRDLHDEVGGILTGIAMRMDVMETVATPGQQEWMHDIGHASREALSKMKDVIWSIDPRKDKVSELVIQMREYANDTFQPLDVQWELKEDWSGSDDYLTTKVRHHVYLIFKEAITNIAKHARAENVEISLMIGQHLALAICDDGRGFAVAEENRGSGLKNMRQRAEEIGGDLQITANPGTCIRLRIQRFTPKVRGWLWRGTNVLSPYARHPHRDH